MAAILAWDSLRRSCPHRVGREESAEAWGVKPLLEGYARIPWQVHQPRPCLVLEEACKGPKCHGPAAGIGSAVLRGSFATMIAAQIAGIRRSVAYRRFATIVYATRRNRGKPTPPTQCGDVLTAKVTEILDAGLVLHTADGSEVFIASLELRRPKEEYTINEELEVSIVQLPSPRRGREGGQRAFRATDRPLEPMSSVRRGNNVDGRILKISDAGVLLDINAPKHGYACWKHLDPLGKKPSEYQVGDTIRRLKVRSINPSNVQLGAASLELRDVSDFKVGDKVKGIVVNVAPRFGAVFFDIGAPRHAAALSRNDQLPKNIKDYTHGEQLMLEVVKIEGEKIDVRDMGFTNGPDRPVVPMTNVHIGRYVDGTIAQITDVGVILDIGMSRRGCASWEHLKPLGKDQTDYRDGEKIAGLRVRGINPSFVQLGAASLKLREVSDFEIGEQVTGIVVNVVTRNNLVFFDIGANTDAAAFRRKDQLTKKAGDYAHGEAVLLEVVNVEGGKIDVKDLGASLSTQKKRVCLGKRDEHC